MRRTLRAWLGAAATLALLGPVALLWYDSRVPSVYDMAAMGVPDHGGGPPVEHHHHGGLSVTELTGPRVGTPDVTVTLTARFDRGRYTLNGTSPGPEIRAKQGQLIQVTLVNESAPDGVTLHWHGVDVPNAEDGVAGVTQDAVFPGGRHVYRFVAVDEGTYWYHSHQASHEQVRRGLFGALVVEPRRGLEVADPVLAVHTYDGRRTINAAAGVSGGVAGGVSDGVSGGVAGAVSGGVPGGVAPRSGVSAEAAVSADRRVRARVINTDAGPIRVWVAGTAYRVVAVDGHDVHQPGELRDTAVLLTAGGRVDLEFTAPGRVDVGGGAAATFGAAPGSPEPRDTLDLLSYGSPAPLGLDPARANRAFDYRIGRRFGFLNGRPGMWWTVNGRLFPDVPMFLVQRGDVIRMTISNDSGEVHPMHLHGHHAVVLSRNGVPASGSPWWVDSLDVADGDSYEIAFRADNPGIWADHCHNLEHVPEGLVAHLAYAGVTTPYRVGNGNVPD